MKVAMTLAVASCAFAFMGADHNPAGSLGHPLGTFLTIEGTRPFKAEMEPALKGTKDAGALMVDTINGKRLSDPDRIYIRIKNGHLGAEAHYVLRGYETGHMAGIPFENADDEKEFWDTHASAQSSWQPFFHLECEFVVTEVREPKGVQLGKEPGSSFVVGLARESKLPARIR